MRLSVALAAALLLAAAPAEAQCIGFQCPVGQFAPALGLPLDGITAPTACYSERRLRTAYTAGLGIRIVRASDSAQSDIGFTAAGAPDTATETAFCAATTCKLVTVYDQCGTRNLTQATDANRFTRQAGPGGFRASQATASAQVHISAANLTPATGLMTLSSVAMRSAGTGQCRFVRANGTNNQLIARGGAVGITLMGGTSGSISTSGADGVWRAMVGVMAGASSVLNVDGTESGPGNSPTGNTTAAPVAFSGAGSSTCNEVEMIIWDNYAMPAGDRAYVVARQRTAWGF